MNRNIKFKTVRINKSEGFVKNELVISEDYTANLQHRQDQLPKTHGSSKFIIPIYLGNFGSKEVTTFLYKLWELIQGLFG